VIEIVEFGLCLEGIVELFGVVELGQVLALFDCAAVRDECDESDTVPLYAGDLGYLDRIDPESAHQSGDTDKRRGGWLRRLRLRHGVGFDDIIRAGTASGEHQREEQEYERMHHGGFAVFGLDVEKVKNV
jgi:hypothetical protein